MERVVVSSKGQIFIPQTVRELLNLHEGMKLTLQVRGHEIVLSKEPVWEKLQGAAAGTDLITAYSAHKREERA